MADQFTQEQFQNAVSQAVAEAMRQQAACGTPQVVYLPTPQAPSLVERAWDRVTSPSTWHPAVQWGAGIAAAAALVGVGVFIGKRMMGGDD